MKHETVEEYLARGGKINKIPRGQGKDQIRMVRSKTSADRVKYVSGSVKAFNGKEREA